RHGDDRRHAAGHLRHQHVERHAQFGEDRLADQRGGHELDPVRDHDAAERDRRRRVRPDPRAHAEGPHAEHHVLLRSHRDGPGREHGGGQQRWSVLHLHDAPDPARPPARRRLRPELRDVLHARPLRGRPGLRLLGHRDAGHPGPHRSGQLQGRHLVHARLRGHVPVPDGPDELPRRRRASAPDRQNMMDRLLSWIIPPLYGVRLSPKTQSSQTVPGATVSYDFKVVNRGIALPQDTFNLAWSSAPFAWPTSLWYANGSAVTDTNGDGVPDTGPIPSKGAITLTATVDVPVAAVDGNADVATIMANSVSLPSASSATSATTLVPPAGVFVAAGPADVPTFHNTNQRRGASPNLFGPPMSQLWTAPGNTAALYSGPVYAEGKLFATSIDQFLRARDPFLGTTIWSRYLGDGSGIPFYTGWPTVANGVVYVIYYTLSGGNLYALDANTGATIWSIAGFDFNARIPLAYADGMVFGEGRDGRVFALDATTGDVVWTYQTNGLFPWGGVTVAAGTVWASALDPSGTSTGWVFSLDEMTGALRWSFALDGWGGSAPLFAQGNVYVGSFNQGTFPPTGTLWALNAFSGTPIWSTSG